MIICSYSLCLTRFWYKNTASMNGEESRKLLGPSFGGMLLEPIEKFNSRAFARNYMFLKQTLIITQLCQSWLYHISFFTIYLTGRRSRPASITTVSADHTASSCSHPGQTRLNCQSRCYQVDTRLPGIEERSQEPQVGPLDIQLQWTQKRSECFRKPNELVTFQRKRQWCWVSGDTAKASCISSVSNSQNFITVIFMKNLQESDTKVKPGRPNFYKLYTLAVSSVGQRTEAKPERCALTKKELPERSSQQTRFKGKEFSTKLNCY